MGSLSGILQRPLVAAAAVAAASFSTDLTDKLPSVETSDVSHSSLPSDSQGSKISWVSQKSVSKLAELSFVAKIRVPVPNVSFPVRNLGRDLVPNALGSSVASSPLLVNLYQSAELAKGPKSTKVVKPIPASSPDVLYRWHLPQPDSIDISGSSDCSWERSRTVVVLLGWLGSKQRHLRKYAEWYTSQGFHVITFTFPMSEILSYQVGGKAEQDVELLVNHLADWLEEEHGKKLIFHTFSNTGWLTYGAILEKFQKQDPSLIGKIRGCIVDSAPVAAADPQVWASGFSAAFLKKNSVAARVQMMPSDRDIDAFVASQTTVEPKPALTEAALLLVLKKLFGVVLNLPSVSRRLSDVLKLLSSEQPRCPQLYFYSSADRVIPVDSVESFIEKQRKAGHVVRACNFRYTPHVDHFRNDPKLYTAQLSQFLDDSVLTCCKHR